MKSASNDKRVNRRIFLKRIGMLWLPASYNLLSNLAISRSSELAPDHFVPLDKNLSPVWLKKLFEKGEPEWFSGEQIKTIGMPIGGICAGQVYLLGEGRLGYWDIFNQQFNSGYGAENWKRGRSPETKVINGKLVYDRPVEHGWAIEVEYRESRIRKLLNQKDFPKLRFRGEYPIGKIIYEDEDNFPVLINVEAFSPFIPLDAHNSSLPVVLFRWRLTSRVAHHVKVRLIGWLSNGVGFYSKRKYGDRIRLNAEFLEWKGSQRAYKGICFSAAWTEHSTPIQEPEMFADFEGDNYGGWLVEGEAFGTSPASGTLSGQQHVSGFEGKRLVNSFVGGDKSIGRMISPEFIIKRKYISFLIGGGDHPGRTCINLIVDGNVVRTATGQNLESLQPFSWNVEDLIGKKARIEIIDAEVGPWGHINVDSIQFRDDPLEVRTDTLATEPDFGTMGIYAIYEPSTFNGNIIFGGPKLSTEMEASQIWEKVTEHSSSVPKPSPEGGWIGYEIDLNEGEELNLWFAVIWHFPNLYRDGKWVGNHYARHYSNANAIASYVAINLHELQRFTYLWHNTYYDSTLPWWLLDRIHAPVANLATTTVQWWYNGRFWAWEGVGCCHGTCGHVWNYAQAVARLFPELERSVRQMQDFVEGIGLREDGSIAFRGEGWDMWAADAQAGYVLKAYREHICSSDSTFLNTNWPRIKKAVQFLIQQDKDENGLLEGMQHQTFDQEYYGPNTFTGSLYLAALLAAEQMAKEVGDFNFAQYCRKIFKLGRSLSMKLLWNGEYFIQLVDLEKYPEWQYADGCLSDQLFGQNWAHQLGLGYIYPEDMVKKALRSIWLYNWTPDITKHNRAHPPERWFISPGDPGLFVCTWPKSRHLGPKSTRYRDEVWTGTEYQVASHMIWEGLILEGLSICLAIHERYRPPKFNPWNEVECGDHYARALASWGVLLALSGFVYHGPSRIFSFSPRWQKERFKAAFTASEGWGSISQQLVDQTQTNIIELRWGRLRVQKLRLQLIGHGDVNKIIVEASNKETKVDFGLHENGQEIEIEFEREILLQAGEKLIVKIMYKTS